MDREYAGQRAANNAPASLNLEPKELTMKRAGKTRNPELKGKRVSRAVEQTQEEAVARTGAADARLRTPGRAEKAVSSKGAVKEDASGRTTTTRKVPTMTDGTGAAPTARKSDEASHKPVPRSG